MIENEKLGAFHGLDLWEYTMKNTHGMEVSVLNYGGIIRRIIYPDKFNHKRNRILAYEDISLYEENPMFLGAVIGRVAGRIANASCHLPNGSSLHFEKNEGTCSLHGGDGGFHHCFWHIIPIEEDKEDRLALDYVDLEHDGWPGDLNVRVTYSLNESDEFRIHYHADSNKIGLCNMTSHMYFNLDGIGASPTILDHELSLQADCVQSVDAKTIPTGQFISCADEKIFDFRTLRRIGEYGMDAHLQQKLVHGGYDHAFRFAGKEHIGKLLSRKSGICVDFQTSEESVVVYTCNKVQSKILLEEGKLIPHAGIALETQALPDRIHSESPERVIIALGRPYDSETVFSFSNIRNSRSIPLLFL